MARCLEADDAVAFAHGLMDGSEAEAAEEHIDACDSCRELVSELAKLPVCRSLVTGGTLPPRIEDEPEIEPVRSGEPIEAGHRVGRYVILKRLGAGGMGTVWEAYDPELDRRIALKVLRPSVWLAAGDRARELLAAEAKAMARLSHPNVVAVHDVGTFDEQLFIAMELVDGMSLSRFAEEADSWEPVLAAGRDAGRGLAAAHDAGLIHRDVKPDNILVGADGRVRVTDFGLAQLADGEPSGQRSLAGTPAFMAPEQHRAEVVDERTDQFGLAASIWRAVYGAPAFAGSEWRELSEAVHRGELVEPRRDPLPRSTRRALEQALAADPADRFPSMDALVEGLEVRPRSHRRWYIAGALLAVAASVALTVALLRPANREASVRRAARAEAAAVWGPAHRARMREAFTATSRPYAADLAGRVSATLDRYAGEWTQMRVEAWRATEVRGEQSTTLLDARIECLTRRLRELRALIDLLSRDLTGERVDRSVDAAANLTRVSVCADRARLKARVPPPADAESRRRLAALEDRKAKSEALRRAGDFLAALKVAQAMLPEVETLGHAPLTAELHYLLGNLHREVGDDDKAEESLRAAVAAAAKARDARIDALAWAQLIYLAGWELRDFKRVQEWQVFAEAAAERAASDNVRAVLLRNLGLAHVGAGHYARAEELIRQGAALQRGGLDGSVAEAWRTLQMLGAVAIKRADYTAAVRYYERALEIHKRHYGADHVDAAVLLTNLGSALVSLDKLDRARKVLERALALRTQVLGPKHPMTASTHQGLGSLLHKQGKLDQALDQFQRALAILEATRSSDHPSLAMVHLNIGAVLGTLRKYAEARPHFEKALEINKKRLGADHPDVGWAYINIGGVLTGEGKRPEALAAYRKSKEILSRKLGADHPRVGVAWTYVGRGLRGIDDHPAAAKAYAEAVRILQAKLGPEHARVAHALEGQGHAFLGAGKPRQAVRALERALAILRKKKQDPVRIGETEYALARALWQAGDRRRSQKLAAGALRSFGRSGARAETRVRAVKDWLKTRRR